MCGRFTGKATSSAKRIARGPKRAPGRNDTPSSKGAPTMATSAPARPAGSNASGMRPARRAQPLAHADAGAVEDARVGEEREREVRAHEHRVRLERELPGI